MDAVILADDPLARVRIAGLAATERAVRVARRVGAERVIVVDSAAARAAVASLAANAVLVIRADQLVHTPLVADLVRTEAEVALSVDADGTYAGAFVARGASVARACAAIAAGTEAAFVDGAGAQKIVHGEIARHAIATREDRRGAHKLLYRILIKPQDNAITRYLYRPVSFPLTRMLAWTPITPNQISYLVGMLVALGCWLTAHASFNWAIAGTCTVLGASYLDCCDGEIARVKLLSSKYGAWIDTVIDEASSIGYMTALGIHCHLAFGRDYFGHFGFDPWLVAAAVTAGFYVWEMYVIYYNIIVAVGSANSQDYVGKFEVVPTGAPNTVKLVPMAPKVVASDAPRSPIVKFFATYAPYIMRRDFISWGATFMALAHLTQISFIGHVAAGVIALPVLTNDHVRLRALRRRIVRGGQTLATP